MRHLLPGLSGFTRRRERAWRQILAGRRVFSIGGFGPSGPCCCGSSPAGCYTCYPCCIPEHDLVFTVDGSSFTLTYSATGGGGGTPIWQYGSAPTDPFCQVFCGLDGIIEMNLLITIGALTWATTPGQEPSGCAYSCSPLYVAFNVSQPGGSAPYSLGILSDGAPSTACCQQFRVFGCNSLGLPGATVSVYDHSGGTLIASGTTDSSGIVSLTWDLDCSSSVYVTASCARFTSYSATVSPTPGATISASLSAASGYHCIGCGVIPLADTIYLTDSIYGGPVTLTYSGGVWSGSASRTYTADACCASHTFTISYTFTGSTCEIGASYGKAKPVVGQAACPNGSSNPSATTLSQDPRTVKSSCGDSTAFSFGATAPSSDPCGDGVDRLYPSGATLTITE